MAYKFQRGEAFLSGALTQEGNIEIESGFEFAMHEETILDTSRNLTVAGISGSGNLQAGGTVRLDGVASATAVAADLVYFRDADDSLMKGESFADIRDNLIYASVSGDATVAAGGALTIAADSVEGTMLNTNSADGSTLELSSDSLSVLKVPNALSQGDGVTAFSFDGSGTATIALSASVAGDGLGYSSGVLAVQVHGNGGIELASDSLHQRYHPSVLLPTQQELDNACRT